MQLPDLSGLRVAPRDRRRAPCATGGTFATLFVGRFINSAKMTKGQLRYEIGKVLGTLFLDRLKGIEGDGFSLTADGDAVAFRYFLDSKVRRKIVFSELDREIVRYGGDHDLFEAGICVPLPSL